MKRQAEYLVVKRDGRCEWLRATKLARSIQRALESAGCVTREPALDLATEVVGRLRRNRCDEMLDVERIAAAARAVMIERGYTRAAVLYAEGRGKSRFGRDRARSVDGPDFRLN